MGARAYSGIQAAEKRECDDRNVCLGENQLQGHKGAMVETPLAVLSHLHARIPASFDCGVN